MLTNLNWLSVGEPFPPKCEYDRLNMYQHNRELFECKHATVYHDALKRIERVIGNWDQVISYPVIMNFQKIMSLKIADLLLGETPKITSKTDQDSLDLIIKNSDLLNTAYQNAIDISRYGDGLFNVRKESDHGVVDLAQPCLWFPIVTEDNVHTVQYHVLAWKTVRTVSPTGNTYGLRVQIHEKGRYEEREYELQDNTISKLLASGRFVQTGLTDFAIVQASNIMTSDRITGIDDYTDIDSIVSDLIVRIGQIDRILDKHAAPDMYGPQSALEQNPVSREWRFKKGNYLIVEAEDAKPGYVTWDGQLEANFKQIERLVNLLYTISEMGSALFGDMSNSTGNVPSGSALKRLMISPLAKVNRIRMRLDKALKTAIMLCSQMGGPGIKRLEYDDIGITWQDGIPSDPEEESRIIASRTGQAATMSQYTAIMRYDGMTEKQAEEELARIQDEQSIMNPVVIPPVALQEESQTPVTPEETEG